MLFFPSCLLPKSSSVVLPFLQSITNEHTEYRKDFVLSGKKKEGFFESLAAKLLSLPHLRVYSISKTDIYFEDSTSNELGFLHCLTQYETIEQLVFIGLRVWSKSQYCLLALMGHIVYSLYKNRSGLVVEEFIPCSHCFRSIDSEEGEGERKEITRFPVLEVINGLQDERECVFCGEVMVRLSDLAPDILFKDLDEFKVLNVEKSQLLGEGGEGEVYKAILDNKKEVALKKVKQVENPHIGGFLISEKLYRSFRKEAFIMAKLVHQNLVRLEGLVVRPLGLVIEFVPGGDLQSLLESHPEVVLEKDVTVGDSVLNSGEKFLLVDPLVLPQTEREVTLEGYPNRRYKINSTDLQISVEKEPLPDKELSWRWRIRVALDIARGMSYLHNQKPPIVHNDLRSPNVCIMSLDPDSKEPIGKILDFGLSEILAIKERTSLMTWQWIAPEVLSHYLCDHAVDIYSFGIVLNELASRKCPFVDDYWDRYSTSDGLQWRSPMACREAIVNGLRPIIPNSCPLQFRRLIERCWSHSPSDRPSFSTIVPLLEEMVLEFEKNP